MPDAPIFTLEHAFLIIGGLGIFLYGINMLTESLKRLSSETIRNILHKATSFPILGTMTGIAATALIQSSSATTVLTVGFVNAGLMNLKQAVSVIFGANIGTTVTGQLMAFKVSQYALPFLFVGILLYIFAKKDSIKGVGALIMGFSMIFFGMHLMSQGVLPLKQSEMVMTMFQNFSHNPILGVIAGMVITMLLQSSSATVGLVLTLVGSGLINLDGAIPIILGDNIGTCITAALASIGTNLAAKRTAVAHFGFNIIGTAIAVALLPFYKSLILMTSTDTVRQAANAHTIFNVLNTLLFLPFTSLYTKFIELIIPGVVKIKQDRAIYLNKNLLFTPPIAFEAVHKEMARALTLSDESLTEINQILSANNYQKVDSLKTNEEIIDNIQYDITKFLVELSRKELSKNYADSIPKILHSINDIERIGDHGESMYYILNRKRKLKIEFPEVYTQNLLLMLEGVQEFQHLVIEYVEHKQDVNLKKAYEYENRINKQKRKFQEVYFAECGEQYEHALNGMVYYDILINFEKIGDHLINIAEAYNEIRY
ncbi:MAG: Na/Pi cotransporter family protein [Spirochaetales bacterium]|nr:Na/Pi cotransporter family protein [Spirochaetales bacterium]